MKHLFIPLAFVLSTVCLAAEYPADLYFYSKFDSAADIVNPQVGPSGTDLGATFQEGALYVPARSCVAEFPMPAALPSDKGCIEFRGKIMNTASYFIDGGDPTFFQILTPSSDSMITLEFNANNGGARSGLYLMSFAGGLVGCIQNNYWSGRLDYSTVFGSKDAKDWHHYAVVWNKDGIADSQDFVRVYLDGEQFMSVPKSQYVAAEFARQRTESALLRFSRADKYWGKSPYLIDEFRIWTTDKTSFDDTPVTPPVTPVSVSKVTARQHYPWCGKIDIGYTVAGATDGLQVKITVTDNENVLTYEAKTFDKVPTASAGDHLLVWNATADGVTKASANLVATVSLIVPAE